MGKCTNCKNVLNKKTKGLLCRNCYLIRNKSGTITTATPMTNDILDDNSNINPVYNNKLTLNGDVDNDNDLTFNERDMVTFIKDSMLKEKAWNEEIRVILNDQIKHLKTEIIFKNTLIEQLICELDNRNNPASYITDNNNNNNKTNNNYNNNNNTINNNNNNSSIMSSLNNTTVEPNLSTNGNSSSYETSSIVQTSSAVKERRTAPKEKRDKLRNEINQTSIISPNPFRYLVDDMQSNFEDEVETNKITRKRFPMVNSSSIRNVDRRPNIVTQANPEKNYVNMKTRPGNSLYSSMSKQGKKIAIISDSLCSGINIKELNQYIVNGFTYRKSFPGVSAKDLSHHCLPTLQEDKPDTCIINVGSNDVGRLHPENICKHILKTVETCHQNGVNDVYVSSIPYRVGKQQPVIDINNFLRARTFVNDFILIDNSNIAYDDIFRDNIHLNFNGTKKIANNFIRAINGKRAA